MFTLRGEKGTSAVALGDDGGDPASGQLCNRNLK
jgi:hypothetical protein